MKEQVQHERNRDDVLLNHWQKFPKLQKREIHLIYEVQLKYFCYGPPFSASQKIGQLFYANEVRGQ